MYRQSQATSIGFDNPYMLLFAPISIAILFLLYMRSRKRVYELSAKLGKAGDTRVAKLVAIAKFAVPILLSLAAAQPYTVTVSHMAITMDNVLDVNTANIRIIVMLDTSKSMGYGDVPPSRIEKAVDMVLNLVSMAVGKGDTIEVYGFSNKVKPLCIYINMSSIDQCKHILSGIELENYTAIGDAILFGYAKARASSIPTAIILLTDGASNYGTPVEDSIKSVASSGIPMAVVIVGSDARAMKLENACRSMGIPIFRVGASSSGEEAIKYISEKLYAKTRFEALKSFGQLYTTGIPVKDYSIQFYILLFAIPLLIASVAEGI